MCPSGCHVLHLVHGDTRCPTLSIQVPRTAPHPSRIHKHHCSRGTTYSTIHPCSRGTTCPTLSTQAPHPPRLHQSTERYQSEALQVSLCLRHVGWGGPQPAHQAQAHLCIRGQPSSQICWCSGEAESKSTATDGCQPPAPVQWTEAWRIRAMSLLLCMF